MQPLGSSSARRGALQVGKGCLAYAVARWQRGKRACGAAAGYAAPSFAVHCAQLAGMHGDILARASQVSGWLFLPCACRINLKCNACCSQHLCACAWQVIELHRQGRSVPCQRTAAQAQREGAFRGLVQQLLATDVRDEAALQALLAYARQRGPPPQQLGSSSADDVSASA
jgi:hypothetical protein